MVARKLVHPPHGYFHLVDLFIIITFHTGQKEFATINTCIESLTELISRHSVQHKWYSPQSYTCYFPIMLVLIIIQRWIHETESPSELQAKITWFHARKTFSSASCSPSIASAPSALLLLSTAAAVCPLTIRDDRAIRTFLACLLVLPLVSLVLPVSNSAANGWRTSIVDPLIYYAATTATRGIYQRFISVLSWCCGYLLNKCDLCSSTWREDPYYSRIPRCHYVFSTTLFESNSLSSTITSSNNVTCVKREYGSRGYGSMSSSFVVRTALISGGYLR